MLKYGSLLMMAAACAFVPSRIKPPAYTSQDIKAEALADGIRITISFPTTQAAMAAGNFCVLKIKPKNAMRLQLEPRMLFMVLPNLAVGSRTRILTIKNFTLSKWGVTREDYTNLYIEPLFTAFEEM